MKFYYIIIIIFSSFACRFVAPGSSQTAELESRGMFPSGPPAWAKLPKEQRSNSLPASSGFIKRTHTIPTGMSMSSSANASSPTSSSIGRGLSSDRRESNDDEKATDWRSRRLKEKKDKEDKEIDASTKILDEIEENCTGRESQVLDALKTENISERIEKFVSLTRVCPQSVNIWLWLAKDYKTIGRLSDSRRCLRAIFVLDPENEEARQLYENFEKSSKN